jgi:uncharacterized protein DUF2630
VRTGEYACTLGVMANDGDIQARIKALIDEEHGLREALASGELTEAEEHERLARAEVELDQCWDLLRQRRAKRDYSQDPDGAQVRSEGTVENYLG